MKVLALLVVMLTITILTGCGGGGVTSDTNPLDYNVRAYAFADRSHEQVELPATITVSVPGQRSVSGIGHCYVNAPVGAEITVTWGTYQGKTPSPTIITVVAGTNIIISDYNP